MDVTDLTKNSTNKELIEAFGEENLNSGKCFVFSVADTKSEEYKTIFVCQMIKNTGVTSAAQKLLLGWSDNRLVRGLHGSATKIAENIHPGQVLPLDIYIEEKLEPQYEGQNCKVYPNSHPKAGQPVLFEGQPIYEHGFLVEEGKGGIKKLVSKVENILANLKPNGLKEEVKIDTEVSSPSGL